MVTPRVATQFPQPIRALEHVLSVFDGVGEKVAANPSLGNTKVIWRGTKEMPSSYRMDELRAALWNHRYDTAVLGKKSDGDRIRLRDKVDNALLSAQGVMEAWAFYAKKGNDHTFNQATLIIPEDIPGPVVLDATATQNFLWELFESRCELYPLREHPRRYDNVTLHVSRCLGVGKAKMVEKHKERVPRLIEDLQQRLGKDRKVFLCCHKAVKPFAQTFEPAFDAFSVGHWGAIDGRNDWKDYDAVVLFGLSYRDDVWANNAFMAFRGLQPDEWVANPVFKDYENVRTEMEQRQLAVSIIQAINRVQCRKVVDADGNCAPTDAFLTLPKNVTGDAILAALAVEMPGLKVVDWDLPLDPENQRVPTVRKGSTHEALVSYMENQSPGEHLVSDVQAALDISPDTWKESIQRVLKDPDHVLAKALADLRVTYVPGRGRYAKSVLVKL